MRGTIALVVASLGLGAAPAAAGPRLTPAAELERALEGRVAGEPQNCITLRNVRSTRIINDTAILYDAGGIVYVNRPEFGAESLDRWDVLVSRSFGSQLCSVDVVTVYDSGSSFLRGSVFLGKFVPYRRIRTGSAR